MQETRVLSLVQEHPLEKEMATHSCILAWEVPWTGEPGRLQSMGLQRVRHDLATEQQMLNVPGSVIKKLPANAGDAGLTPGSGRSPGEGNGNPLQYSCLGNPMDRGV